MRKQANQKKQKSSTAKEVARLERAVRPPAIQDIALTHKRRMRYIADANTLDTITFQDILDTMLVAATATQGYQLFQAVRIVEVEAWHCPVGSSVSTLVVEFDGAIAGFVGNQKIHTDSSMGTRPAHLRVRPGAKTSAALWQPSSASTAFRIEAPAGTILDVVVELRGQFNAGVAVQAALVGATAGGVYLRGIDGDLATGSNWTPAIGNSAWIK
jgi:hypothetical protein